MFPFYISASAVLIAFIAAGVAIGSKGGKKDYGLGGRSAGASGVTGILLGALVGGASTVGTTQMAYTYGLTAWWFTLGGGIGCLLLGLRFAAPLRGSEITTIADYLKKSYGGEKHEEAIAKVATVSSSLGTFISICGQFLSCTALISGAVSIPAWAAAVVAALSVWGFIAAGGMKSFSVLGAAKIVLLYFALILCGIAAYRHGEGFVATARTLGFHPWFNVFGRGFFPEAGYLASMIVGVFTTQIYIQAIAAAKDTATARSGAFASALLMPPMGLFGTWVGLTARASGVETEADKVLSLFITTSFPPLLGGVIWSGILITVIGCAAGLTLGVATNITKNFVPRRVHEKFDDNFLQRALVVLIIMAAVLLGHGGDNAMILEWNYLGMGLRGAGTFFPFIMAVLKPGSLPPKTALASSVCGLVGMLVWALLRLPYDPLFAGLAASAVCICLGKRK